MNPTTGRTSGSQRRAFLTADGEAFKADHCKHCQHSDRIRLRRLPKWLQYVEHMPATGQWWWPVGRRVFKQEMRRQMALPVPF